MLFVFWASVGMAVSSITTPFQCSGSFILFYVSHPVGLPSLGLFPLLFMEEAAAVASSLSVDLQETLEKFTCVPNKVQRQPY